MSETPWTRIRELLEEALELPPAERQAFLREACPSAETRAEVERYLAADASAGGVLDAGVSELLPKPAEDAPTAGDEADRPEAHEAPDMIGPYRLGEVLGEGGMGTVYRAVQTEPVRREVALKIIKPGMDTKEVVARFQAERQALALMNHASIARVYDAGATGTGRPYFVMELVHGVPLDEYCDTHRLSTEDRLELFASICDAVHHAHQRGVIHRDLKPSNILVTVQDSKPVPKVIDFGIARAVSDAQRVGGLVTTMGQMLGTPAYMSPEQAEHSGLDVDIRTDVYSLGVLLYELLSGSLPFDRGTLNKPDFIVQYLLRERDVPTPSVRLGELADTQQTVARNRKTDVRTLRRALRGDLDWVVMRAMDKDRTRRYAAASELAADVRRYIAGEPVTARPPSAWYRTRKFARRNRAAFGAAAALVVSLVFGSVAAGVGYVRAERSAGIARAEAERAEAVTDFLNDMLRAADPVRGSGAATTVADVLESATEEISRGAFAGQPRVEMAVRRSIGGTYMQLGLLDEAASHLEVVAALMASTPDVTALERVRSLDEIGQVRRRQGQLDAAEARYRHALALADSAGLDSDGGPGELLVNQVRSDLGLALRSADRIDEAADLLEDVVDSERALDSVDRLDRASTLNNLALVRRAQGRIDEAIALFHETLDLLRAEFGNEHVYVAAVLESIGSLEGRAERFVVADSLMREALGIRRRVLPERHPDIVNGLNGLGLLHVESGDHAAAERYLDEALEMSLSVHGEEHTQTASVLNNLGLLHLRQERYEASAAAFRRGVRIREAVLPPGHRNTLNTRANLAAALLGGGDAEAAAELASEVVAAQSAADVDDVVMRGSALRTWGSALGELGRHGEGEARLLEAYRLQVDGLGEGHAQTRSTAGRLSELYDAWGRPADAAEWRGRADASS